MMAVTLMMMYIDDVYEVWGTRSIGAPVDYTVL